MAEIGKTNGGQTVLELRNGVIKDILTADQKNWRVVIENMGALDGYTEKRIDATYTVKGDGSAIDKVWKIIPLPEVEAKLKLKDRAAEIRWLRGNQGAKLADGTIIKTDVVSRANVIGAYLALDEGWVTTLPWKSKTGWMDLDLAAMTVVAKTVSAYVEALFTAEKDISDQIEAGTITTSSEIDSYSWPT